MDIPGITPGSTEGLPNRALSEELLNKTGAAVSAGMLLVLETTPANHAAGAQTPVKAVSSAATANPVGVVPAGWASSPDGAPVIVQHSGLCEVLVDNSGGALTAGDLIGTGTALGVAAEVADRDNAVGIYVDADYNSATAALKKVYLINPMGLP